MTRLVVVLATCTVVLPHRDLHGRSFIDAAHHDDVDTIDDDHNHKDDDDNDDDDQSAVCTVRPIVPISWVHESV